MSSFFYYLNVPSGSFDIVIFVFCSLVLLVNLGHFVLVVIIGLLHLFVLLLGLFVHIFLIIIVLLVLRFIR